MCFVASRHFWNQFPEDRLILLLMTQFITQSSSVLAYWVYNNNIIKWLQWCLNIVGLVDWMIIHTCPYNSFLVCNLLQGIIALTKLQKHQQKEIKSTIVRKTTNFRSGFFNISWRSSWIMHPWCAVVSCSSSWQQW